MKRAPAPCKLQAPQTLDPPMLALLWISEFILSGKLNSLGMHYAHKILRQVPSGVRTDPSLIQLDHLVGSLPL